MEGIQNCYQQHGQVNSKSETKNHRPITPKEQQSCSLELLPSSFAACFNCGVAKRDEMQKCDQNSPLVEKAFIIVGVKSVNYLVIRGNLLGMFTDL